ncbi:MAG: topoisomerase, partial [Myxococcales bacterium]|nr:topoisomerase [Myxococcales bacterium]
MIVAEKPSVGRDLARVLGVRGNGRSAIEGTDRVITWCIGHLVELEEPASYDGRWKAWRLDTLPMIPAAFKLRPVAGTRDQLHAVTGLLRDRRFTEVVNACDAGREGELIFRYVYELAGSRLPVRRLWISSLTDEAIRAGFAALRPGAAYDPLGDAARSRSEADWLVGMNATRAVTVSSRTGGPPSRPAPRPPAPRGGRGRERQTRQTSDAPLFSIGRVQTPTLAIVVRRDEEIRQFRPRDYWEVRGTFTTVAAQQSADAPSSFAATWGMPLTGGKAIGHRLDARPLADALLARAGAHAGAADSAGPVVERLRQRQLREPPPLLFDLTSLQRTANRRFGLSATATLAAAQALYERHKVLSYPRTDARHLSGDMAGELPKIFTSLTALPAYAPFAQPLLAKPPARTRRVFDDAKVHDHHAIIPTGKAVRLAELSHDEGRIFDLVVRRFLGAFHPDAEFALTDVVVRVGASPPDTTLPALPGDGATADETSLAALPPPPDRFFARGRVRMVAGWQAVAQIGEARPAGASGGAEKGRAKGGDAEADADAQSGPSLPPLREGQRLDGKFEPVAKQTRPPPPHTEATLLTAMEYAGRDIADETLRAAMRDFGLGTPATRAATIEILIRRAFVVREGKLLKATALGASLINRLPVASLASPELTGQWEARLARVARGEETRVAFMNDIAAYVRDVVTAIRARPVSAGGVATVTATITPKATTTNTSRPPVAAPAVSTTEAAPAAPLPCPRCREGTLVAG